MSDKLEITEDRAVVFDKPEITEDRAAVFHKPDVTEDKAAVPDKATAKKSKDSTVQKPQDQAPVPSKNKDRAAPEEKPDIKPEGPKTKPSVGDEDALQAELTDETRGEVRIQESLGKVLDVVEQKQMQPEKDDVDLTQVSSTNDNKMEETTAAASSEGTDDGKIEIGSQEPTSMLDLENRVSSVVDKVDDSTKSAEVKSTDEEKVDGSSKSPERFNDEKLQDSSKDVDVTETSDGTLPATSVHFETIRTVPSIAVTERKGDREICEPQRTLPVSIPQTGEDSTKDQHPADESELETAKDDQNVCLERAQRPDDIQRSGDTALLGKTEIQPTRETGKIPERSECETVSKLPVAPSQQHVVRVSGGISVGEMTVVEQHPDTDRIHKVLPDQVDTFVDTDHITDVDGSKELELDDQTSEGMATDDTRGPRGKREIQTSYETSKTTLRTETEIVGKVSIAPSQHDTVKLSGEISAGEMSVMEREPETKITPGQVNQSVDIDQDLGVEDIKDERLESQQQIPPVISPDEQRSDRTPTDDTQKDTPPSHGKHETHALYETTDTTVMTETEKIGKVPLAPGQKGVAELSGDITFGEMRVSEPDSDTMMGDMLPDQEDTTVKGGQIDHADETKDQTPLTEDGKELDTASSKRMTTDDIQRPRDTGGKDQVEICNETKKTSESKISDKAPVAASLQGVVHLSGDLTVREMKVSKPDSKLGMTGDVTPDELDTAAEASHIHDADDDTEGQTSVTEEDGKKEIVEPDEASSDRAVAGDTHRPRDPHGKRAMQTSYETSKTSVRTETEIIGKVPIAADQYGVVTLSGEMSVGEMTVMERKPSTDNTDDTTPAVTEAGTEPHQDQDKDSHTSPKPKQQTPKPDGQSILTGQTPDDTGALQETQPGMPLKVLMPSESTEATTRTETMVASEVSVAPGQQGMVRLSGDITVGEMKVKPGESDARNLEDISNDQTYIYGDGVAVAMATAEVDSSHQSVGKDGGEEGLRTGDQHREVDKPHTEKPDASGTDLEQDVKVELKPGMVVVQGRDQTGMIEVVAERRAREPDDRDSSSPVPAKHARIATPSVTVELDEGASSQHLPVDTGSRDVDTMEEFAAEQTPHSLSSSSSAKHKTHILETEVDSSWSPPVLQVTGPLLCIPVHAFLPTCPACFQVIPPFTVCNRVRRYRSLIGPELFIHPVWSPLICLVMCVTYRHSSDPYIVSVHVFPACT